MKKLLAILLVVSSLAQAETKAPVATAEIDQKSAHARKLYHALKAGDTPFIQQVLKESNDSQEEQFKRVIAVLEQSSQKNWDKSTVLQSAVLFGFASGLVTGFVANLISVIYHSYSKSSQKSSR